MPSSPRSKLGKQDIAAGYTQGINLKRKRKKKKKVGGERKFQQIPPERILISFIYTSVDIHISERDTWISTELPSSINSTVEKWIFLGCNS